MQLKILKALLKKEMVMIAHHPLIPRVMLLMPIMVMLVVPLVANLDVRHVNVAVVDPTPSYVTRRVTADVDASPVITVSRRCHTPGEAMREIERGRADVVLTFPAKFATGGGKISVEANGVNATRGLLGARYVAEAATLSLARLHGADAPETGVNIINRYNPTLNFRNYMIPALMVVLIIIICGFLPALNLVSEKESGTIEAINVTPVGRLTFVLSKLIPFWAAGLVVVTIGMVIGRAVYGLAPVGLVGLIYLATLLFSLVMSGLGVTIANRSTTMLQSIFVMFAFIMVFQLMSGLFTPISSMPSWARAITYAIPPRYFIEIMRGVYLKGASLTDLWSQFAALGGLAIVMCGLAALTYRKQA